MILNYSSNPTTINIVSVGPVEDTYDTKMHMDRNSKKADRYAEYKNNDHNLKSKANYWVPGAPQILVIENDLLLD